ncbi:10649_t:CDS:10 [Diversispora eburnea]|uniref:10649_t:CDS:1 n=1 Tax=Diversispora eburnea TaxID=1213867 RepID=A0A9N9FCH4_9GLOM|nr:10649_t:CDS:10 [Diversispora eburnea]
MLELQVGKTDYEEKRKTVKTIVLWFLAAIVYICVYHVLFNQIYVKDAYYISFYTPSCFSYYYLTVNLSQSTNTIKDDDKNTETTTFEKDLSLTSQELKICYDQIHMEHLRLYKELSDKGITIKIRYEFWELINVISIEFEEKHLEIIKSLKYVKNVQPVSKHRIPIKRKNPSLDSKIVNKKRVSRWKRDYISYDDIKLAPGVDINFVHNFTGVFSARKLFKVTGKDIKVGIVDTGVDYNHPALGGCYGPKCRVQYGYNFVDGTSDPLDECIGHGTHVAGIIGGNDTGKGGTGFLGVAPDVTFGVYKVLDCSGSGDNDVIMQGMQMAKDDGMSIINLSISGEGWAESPMAEMTNVLAKFGILVAVADGNYGSDGLWESGIPATGANALAVSSVDNSHLLVQKATGEYNNVSVEIDYMTKYVRPFPLTKVKIAVYPNDDCPTDLSIYKSKILMIDIPNMLSTCSLDSTSLQENVVGLFAVEYNISAPSYPSLSMPDYFTVPYATLIPKQYYNLVNIVNNYSDFELDFSDKYTYTVINEYGKSPSYFTSWGPAPELDMKPEISAPGGIIFSLYPLVFGGYSLMSGTSMASPYIAGSAALILEKLKVKKSFEVTRALLMNFAIPTTDVTINEIAPIYQQGVGFINILNSLSSSITISPIKINLNDTINGNFDWHTLKITNEGNSSINYTLVHCPVISVNGYISGTNFGASFFQLSFNKTITAEVEFDNTWIEVGPKMNASIKVKITPPKILGSEKRWFYNGYIQFKPTDNSSTLSIPYAGLSTPAKELPIFPTPQYPQLFNSDYNILYSNTTFTMKNGDIPYIAYALVTPTRYLAAYILDKNKKLLFLYADADYVWKTTYYTSYSIPVVFSWSGVDLLNNDLPNGTYFLKLSALKLLGDQNNNTEYEDWISPGIIISRPK